MKTLTKLTLLTFITCSLLGCYNKEKLREHIQKEYERSMSLTKTKGNLCYYLGSVKLPYTDEPVLESDTQWASWNKGKLAKTLPLFAELGLLNQMPVEGQSGIYRYDLTDLGREYWYQYINNNGKKTIYYSSFCYGPKKIVKVKDITEKTYESGLYRKNQTNVYVKIDFQVLDTPDWALKGQDKINELYGRNSVFLPNKIYPDTITFIKGDDGELYHEPITLFMMKP
ncbi:hypothetical protein GYM75_09160 [Gilliamella sp. ESL0441]|uniref:hypothetical protein n=1 Tax=Gilliamella sp. ESL0441 TaxID=2704654 RepID=UPI001C6A324D|nr:hypothetical protein [Gilliamella sp. ESL0441]QYN44996.1 hypothetical protein GYM75_09160 [Gilliamella sp. ESL0441]